MLFYLGFYLNFILPTVKTVQRFHRKSFFCSLLSRNGSCLFFRAWGHIIWSERCLKVGEKELLGYL